MQAIGVELLGPRCALRAVQAKAQVQRVGHLPAEAGGGAGGVHVPIRRGGAAVVDIDAVVVVAQAEVDLQVAECTLADPEQAGVVAA